MKYLILMVTFCVILFFEGCIPNELYLMNFFDETNPNITNSNEFFRTDGYYISSNSPRNEFLIFYSNGTVLNCLILDTNKFFKNDYRIDCPNISKNTKMKYQTYYGFFQTNRDTISYISLLQKGGISEVRLIIKNSTTLVAYQNLIRQNSRSWKVKETIKINLEYNFYPCLNKPDSTNYWHSLFRDLK